MKKLTKLFMAAAVLLAVACGKDVTTPDGENVDPTPTPTPSPEYSIEGDWYVSDATDPLANCFTFNLKTKEFIQGVYNCSEENQGMLGPELKPGEALFSMGLPIKTITCENNSGVVIVSVDDVDLNIEFSELTENSVKVLCADLGIGIGDPMTNSMKPMEIVRASNPFVWIDPSTLPVADVDPCELTFAATDGPENTQTAELMVINFDGNISLSPLENFTATLNAEKNLITVAPKSANTQSIDLEEGLVISLEGTDVQTELFLIQSAAEATPEPEPGLTDLYQAYLDGQVITIAG